MAELSPPPIRGLCHHALSPRCHPPSPAAAGYLLVRPARRDRHGGRGGREQNGSRALADGGGGEGPCVMVPLTPRYLNWDSLYLAAHLSPR